jgi:hypothetical protein
VCALVVVTGVDGAGIVVVAHRVVAAAGVWNGDVLALVSVAVVLRAHIRVLALGIAAAALWIRIIVTFIVGAPLDRAWVIVFALSGVEAAA